MLKLKTTTKFRKDYKRMKKQGKDLTLLQKVIDDLLAEQILDEKYRDHALTGSYLGFRECHCRIRGILIRMRLLLYIFATLRYIKVRNTTDRVMKTGQNKRICSE